MARWSQDKSMRLSKLMTEQTYTVVLSSAQVAALDWIACRALEESWGDVTDTRALSTGMWKLRTARMNDEVLDRVCIDCDKQYTGGIHCPVCKCSSGEPLADIVEAERMTVDVLEKERNQSQQSRSTHVGDSNSGTASGKGEAKVR